MKKGGKEEKGRRGMKRGMEMVMRGRKYRTTMRRIRRVRRREKRRM